MVVVWTQFSCFLDWLKTFGQKSKSKIQQQQPQTNLSHHMSHRAYERATMSKLIYLVLLFFVFEGKVYSESVWGLDSLYSSNDTGIQTSNVTNFQDILFNNDKVTVYQFYNSCKFFCVFFVHFVGYLSI